MSKICSDCKEADLLTKKSLVTGKCVRCRNKTKTELKRRQKWNELLSNAQQLPEGDDKRKIILGIIKGRRNFLKTGDLGGTVEREFGFETTRDMKMSDNIKKGRKYTD